MTILEISLLVAAALTGLWYAGYEWAKGRTSVRSDLVELDRQEDKYRYGFLDRLGRRVKSAKMSWLKRGKAQQKSPDSSSQGFN